MAYDRKNWSVNNLCDALTDHADTLDIVWGWRVDPKTRGFENVFYVEIPTGQVSFHQSSRGKGPDYPKEWDQLVGVGPTRICRWIEQILEGKVSNVAA